MGAGSLTPSVWVPSSTGIGSAEGVGISVGTSCVAAGVAEVKALATTLASSKKPSMGVPMVVEPPKSWGDKWRWAWTQPEEHEKKSGDAYIYEKKRRERNGAHNDAWQWEHMQERKRGRERERHTSNSGLSSNIGRVVDVSSLCLDYKKEKTKGRE